MGVSDIAPPPDASILTSNQVLNELQNLQEFRPTQLVVLVRQKKEDGQASPDTNRKVGDTSRSFESVLHFCMKDLLRQHLECSDFKLSDCYFKSKDPAHQTIDFLKMSISKIVRFYG